MSTINQVAHRISEELIGCGNWERLTTINSNWRKDPLFHNYHKLGNKQKGVLGEYYVEKLMEANGSTVEKSSDTGHDRIIDGFRTPEQQEAFMPLF